MKPSLCKTLATSRVGAVAIAVLLFWALLDVFHFLLAPLSSLVTFIGLAVLMLRIPYHPPTLDIEDFILITSASLHFVYGFILLGAAWLLSRLVYGGGPLRILKTYRALLERRNNA